LTKSAPTPTIDRVRFRSRSFFFFVSFRAFSVRVFWPVRRSLVPFLREKLLFPRRAKFVINRRKFCETPFPRKPASELGSRSKPFDRTGVNDFNEPSRPVDASALVAFSFRFGGKSQKDDGNKKLV